MPWNPSTRQWEPDVHAGLPDPIQQYLQQFNAAVSGGQDIIANAQRDNYGYVPMMNVPPTLPQPPNYGEGPTFDPSSYYQNYGDPGAGYQRDRPFFPQQSSFPGLPDDGPPLGGADLWQPGPGQFIPGTQENMLQQWIRSQATGQPVGTPLPENVNPNMITGPSGGEQEWLDYIMATKFGNQANAPANAISTALKVDQNKNTSLPDRGSAGGSFMPGGWQPGSFGGDRMVSPPPPGKGFLAGGQSRPAVPDAAQSTISALAAALQAGTMTPQQAEQVAGRAAQALGIPVGTSSASGGGGALAALGLSPSGQRTGGGAAGAGGAGGVGRGAGGRTGALARRPTSGTGGKSTGVVGGLETPQIPWGERGKSGGYVEHPGDSNRLVKLNPEGHGDFGAGYDSLGNRAVGSMGTGVPDRVLGPQFETMKMMGLVDWTGSLGTWKEAGMPKTGDYNPQDIADYVSGRIDMWELQAKRQGGAGAQPPGAQPGTPPPGQQVPGHPGSMGQYNPMNWMIPGINGQTQPPPMQFPPTGGGPLPGRDDPTVPGGAIPERDEMTSPGRGGMPQLPPGNTGGVARDGMMSYSVMPNSSDPMRYASGVPGGGGGGYDYDLPYFAQPSYTANMTPEQLQQFLAYNNSVALPWAGFNAGMYQYNRNFDEDVRRNDRDYGRNVYVDDRNFGEDVRRDNRNFGEDAFRDRRNYGEDVRRYDQGFGEDVRRDNRNFGEDTRRFDATFGEGRRQFDTTFGEGRRQFDTTFGEGQRQFNESLNWQKKADALRSFGARQMPNVRQMSYR